MNDRAFIECKDKETTMAVAKSIETDDQMFERLPGTAKIATATASISTSSIAAATVATIASCKASQGKKGQIRLQNFDNQGKQIFHSPSS